jgi:hypothetical protein
MASNPPVARMAVASSFLEPLAPPRRPHAGDLSPGGPAVAASPLDTLPDAPATVRCRGDPRRAPSQLNDHKDASSQAAEEAASGGALKRSQGPSRRFMR